ncbi:MAG: hypothetical protein DDT22_00858 [candidate division WS2 bacterium]|nr:hypothetical protein [Candidatus Lithacetigena glycinireducens]
MDRLAFVGFFILFTLAFYSIFGEELTLYLLILVLLSQLVLNWDTLAFGVRRLTIDLKEVEN